MWKDATMTNDNGQYTDWRSNELEFRITECEISAKEYVRIIHSGLILNGRFLERETPTTQAILSYDILNEISAGNFSPKQMGGPL